MKKILLGTAIAALATTGAYAEDYQFELGANYVTGENAGTDFDGFGVYGEVHLDTVDTSKGPLNEAAFLDKSSSVRLDWATKEDDVDGAEAADNVTLSGRFVTQGDWIIEASYLDVDGDDTAIALGVGVYLNDTMDLVVSYGTYDDADKSALAVDIHNVSSLGGDASLAYDVGVSYLDEYSETGYELRGGVDYYFNNAVSIGGSLKLNSINDVDTSTLAVGVDYFVAPAIRLSGEFYTLGQDGDGDGITLSGAVRF